MARKNNEEIADDCPADRLDRRSFLARLFAFVGITAAAPLLLELGGMATVRAAGDDTQPAIEPFRLEVPESDW